MGAAPPFFFSRCRDDNFRIKYAYLAPHYFSKKRAGDYGPLMNFISYYRYCYYRRFSFCREIDAFVVARRRTSFNSNGSFGKIMLAELSTSNNYFIDL